MLRVLATYPPDATGLVREDDVIGFHDSSLRSLPGTRGGSAQWDPARWAAPMAIDATLTEEQKRNSGRAREFAQDMLKSLVAQADAEPDPQKGVQAIKPADVEAYTAGGARGFLPREYGGPGSSHV